MDFEPDGRQRYIQPAAQPRYQTAAPPAPTPPSPALPALPAANSVHKKPKKTKLLGKKAMLVVLLAAVLIAAGSYFVYRYIQAKREVARLSNPEAAAKLEVDQIIAKVGRLVELPAGETPTIATVTDTSKLKSQPFFARAENGDKVLIFAQARRAVLYRPSTDKVIEIAPVNIGETNTPDGTSPSN